MNPTNIDVRAESTDAAIKKAGKIAAHKAVSKEHFVITNITEHDHVQKVNHV